MGMCECKTLRTEMKKLLAFIIQKYGVLYQLLLVIARHKSPVQHTTKAAYSFGTPANAGRRLIVWEDQQRRKYSHLSGTVFISGRFFS